jgi:hypothetical protein
MPVITGKNGIWKMSCFLLAVCSLLIDPLRAGYLLYVNSLHRKEFNLEKPWCCY